MFFALRLDVVGSSYEAFKAVYLAWVVANCESYFIVREVVGDNDHTHAILGSSKKQATLRISLKRAFAGNSGNSFYSLKGADDAHPDYLKYLCKGASKAELPVIVAQCGLDYASPTFVQDNHDAFYVTADTLATQKAKRSTLAGANMVEQVECIAKAAGIRSNDREGVARIYCKLYIDARKGINSFHCRSVVNTVCCHLEGGEDALSVLIAEIACKY